MKSDSATRLETDALGINFGGHHAVSNVSLAFKPGSLTAIVGPNGAGKTTYFNLISGQIKATNGRVTLDGEDLTDLSPAARTKRGIGRAFQLTNLFPKLTVHENLRLVAQTRMERTFNLFSLWSDHQDVTAAAEEALRDSGLWACREQSASELSHGEQRKLEIALLTALQPKVYMFDEPTAGMSIHDVPAVLDMIQKLKDQGDKIILLVEHKMDVIRSLADRVVVLHGGELVADGPPKEVMRSAIVQEAYLGTRRKYEASSSPQKSAA